LGVAGAGSVWKQEVSEILDKHIGGGSGERICAIHRLLVFNANWDT
jgi:hypothetical protein